MLSTVLIGALFALIFNFIIFYKRSQLKHTTYEEVMALDEPFVLYLRSFDIDEKGVTLPVSSVTLFLPQINSYEEDIVKQLRNTKMIAVGHPGEKHPPLGATRLLIQSENWQEKVSRLMDKATYILLKPSHTPGLTWEFNQLLTKKLLDRLVLFHQFSPFKFEKLNKFYYEEFRQEMSRKTGIIMKEYDKRYLFSCFDDGKNHRLIESLKSTPLRNLNDNFEPSKGSNFISDKSENTRFDDQKSADNSVFKILEILLMVLFLFCICWMVVYGLIT